MVSVVSRAASVFHHRAPLSRVACDTIRSIRSIWIMCVCLLVAQIASADYRIFAMTDGPAAVFVEPGDTIELQVHLQSDANDVNNSAVLRLEFSAQGLIYQSRSWHGVYAVSGFDDSTPAALPAILTANSLSGPGYPAGVVDLELSNAVIGAFCVDAQGVAGGVCDCPGGDCIAGTCIGGENAGQGCVNECSLNINCVNGFASGPVITVTLGVPINYAGPDMIEIAVVPDTVANGFVNIETQSCAPFGLYFACIVPGDVDCDARVGQTDYDAWGDCLSGEAGGLGLGCDPFDFDSDGDVDLRDWGAFQHAFSVGCATPDGE